MGTMLYEKLHEKIKEEIKQAMLAKDNAKLSVVRGLVSAFTNELVAKKRKPDERLSDEEVLAVIKRAAKQRLDSIEQFKAGGRADLVDTESAELEILKTYLPAELGEAEIEKVVKEKVKELGLIGKQDTGKLMSIVMKELKGKADGSLVKKVVEKLLV